jgi:hypothetical protein
MDVHKEAIVIAVLDGSGKLVMETIAETKASGILQFLHGLRGEPHVTWDEGTWAAWRYDLLQPQVQEVVVCNLRRNALLLKSGVKIDGFIRKWPKTAHLHGNLCSSRSKFHETGFRPAAVSTCELDAGFSQPSSLRGESWLIAE